MEERNGYSDFYDNRSSFDQDRGRRNERSSRYGSEYNEFSRGRDLDRYGDRSGSDRMRRPVREGRDYEERYGRGSNDYGYGRYGDFDRSEGSDRGDFYGRGDFGYGRGDFGYARNVSGNYGYGASGGFGGSYGATYSGPAGYYGGYGGGSENYRSSNSQFGGAQYGGGTGSEGYRSGSTQYDSSSGGYGEGMRGGYGATGYSVGGYGASGTDFNRGRAFGKPPKGFTRSDERIREVVSERLAEHMDASDITVDVKNGEVTLSGQVDSRHTKYHAEELAEQVLGVKDVDNRIKVNKGFFSNLFGSDEGEREEGRSASRRSSNSESRSSTTAR